MWFAFEIFHSMKKGLGPCVLSLWWGILKMTRFTEQMVTADDTEGEDDRDLGPVPVSWFLSSSKAQVCPGLRRGGGRPRRFCLRWSLITVSKVDDQASQPRSSRKLETHFAINFFCNPWKHLQPWLIYSPCLRTFYCQIVCTYFLPTRCTSCVVYQYRQWEFTYCDGSQGRKGATSEIESSGKEGHGEDDDLTDEEEGERVAGAVQVHRGVVVKAEGWLLPVAGGAVVIIVLVIWGQHLNTWQDRQFYWNIVRPESI